MTLLRLLYLPISFFYLTWGIPLPAESFLPATGHVRSDFDAALYEDLDPQWFESYSRSLQDKESNNWGHAFDHYSLAFMDSPIGHWPSLDDSNKQSTTSEQTSGSGADSLTELQGTSASRDEMALHHPVDVDEPDQPGLTKNQDLHTTSGAKNPLPKQKYHVRPFAVHIQGQHYRSNGRQSARGAQVKYFGTRNTIFDLHQRARKCLDMIKTEDFESNERFEIDASTKLQEIIAYQKICSHQMSMIAQARSITSPVKENLGSLAVSPLPEGRGSMGQTVLQARGVRLHGPA
ncbi:hypothetical protein PCANC_01854 [Puccinia coronata f. sp. avenae]|uniref:Uncharacterized protein n=1 Tax=Puccinia coronata f. sp. avenae TaxID=200324 RepID=A0A2N5W596_9BASI|nr:hypothetical protein PCANC_03389 [Puccinia coronata f. sp. avenae]PLW57409.1 hypothetical protein PCANC_01854 [Puccinia coronata f. sp. avenae]